MSAAEDALRNAAYAAGKAVSTATIRDALAAAEGDLDRALQHCGLPPREPTPQTALLPPGSFSSSEAVANEDEAYSGLSVPVAKAAHPSHGADRPGGCQPCLRQNAVGAVLLAVVCSIGSLAMGLYLRVLAEALALPDTSGWLPGACEVVARPVLNQHRFARHGSQLTAYRLSVPVSLRLASGASVAAVAHRYTSEEFFDANDPDEMGALVGELDASRTTGRPVDCYYGSTASAPGDSLRVSLTLDAPPDENWSAAQTRLDIVLIMAIPMLVCTLAAWMYWLWIMFVLPSYLLRYARRCQRHSWALAPRYRAF